MLTGLPVFRRFSPHLTAEHVAGRRQRATAPTATCRPAHVPDRPKSLADRQVPQRPEWLAPRAEMSGDGRTSARAGFFKVDPRATTGQHLHRAMLTAAEDRGWRCVPSISPKSLRRTRYQKMRACSAPFVTPALTCRHSRRPARYAPTGNTLVGYSWKKVRLGSVDRAGPGRAVHGRHA